MRHAHAYSQPPSPRVTPEPAPAAPETLWVEPEDLRWPPPRELAETRWRLRDWLSAFRARPGGL